MRRGTVQVGFIDEHGAVRRTDSPLPLIPDARYVSHHVAAYDSPALMAYCITVSIILRF